MFKRFFSRLTVGPTFVAAILAMTLAALSQFIWVSTFSGACVVPIVPTLAEQTIDFINSQQQTTGILRGYLRELSADSARLFLYSPELDLRVEHSAVVNENSLQVVGKPSLATLVGEAYTSQKSAHLRGDCFSSEIEKEKQGTYRASAEKAGVEYIQSCPVFENGNVLTGYVAVAYEQVPNRVLLDGLTAKLRSNAEALSDFLSNFQ